jgi:hypothetical protein
MFHAKSLNLEKCDYKIILENLSKLNQSELSDYSPDFRTTMKLFLPPAARGLFLKKPPPGPPAKAFIK